MNLNDEQNYLIESDIEKDINLDISDDIQIHPFQVGDKVRVQILVTEEEDPESFYYLKEFDRKTGEILGIKTDPLLQYKVNFGQKEAILYHRELTIY